MDLRSRVAARKVALWSSSLDADELQRIAKQNRIGGPSDEVVVGYSPGPALKHRRFVLAQQASPKLLVGQFLGNSLAGFLETPTPIGFSHPTEHRWITDIEIAGYLPPRLPNLAAQMVAVGGDTQDVRTTREGWSYCCPHQGTYFGGALDEVLVRPSLRILEVAEILDRVGLSCGLRFSPSEKGAYGEGSLEKFGSLAATAEFLRGAGNRALLDKFVSTERCAQGVTDEGAYVQGRRYLDLMAVAKIVGSTNSAASLLDDLAGKGILHRGFVFQCTFCRNADWYHISKVSEAFECSRCGRSQVYRMEHWKQPAEPAWYYKLDEIIYQGYKQGMTAPILTNDYLRRESSSFQFAAEQNAFEREAATPFMEIDVCAVTDGELLIGEAKTASAIENSGKERQRTIKKYLDLAEKLCVREVVFSTIAEEWSAATLTDLMQAFRKSTIAFRTLTGKHLL